MERRRQGRTAAGLAGVTVGLALLTVLPGDGRAGGLGAVEGALPGVARAVQQPLAPAAEPLAKLRHPAATNAARPVVRAQDPKIEPPLHGAAPHGQGTVAVLDVAPSSDRPQDGDPAGSGSDEEVVVGRARGEQREDGSYHGRITIAALFGNEVLGVDTEPGETQTGPLDAVQQGLLTPLCNGSGNRICLSAVTADSSTNDDGSANRFSAAHATLGGPEGIDAGVAESRGEISDDGTCQTARGESSVASVKAGGQAVADAAQSSTESKACKGSAPAQSNGSRVLALGGTGVPLPAAGCADGTPDVVTGIPVLVPIVCGADDTNGAQAGAPYGVREALSVFVLEAGGSRLLQATTSASESRAVAPRPQCSDGRDNDGDGVADMADPGCDSPNDDDETDESKRQCSDGTDNDGDGKIDARDPGCHTDGDPGNPASYDPRDDDETDPSGRGRETQRPRRAVDEAPECSNGGDDDGDGRIDRDDPGCLSGPGGTYDPSDDDESDVRRELGSLPMTGSDALLAGMAGLLLLAAGLAVRRRIGAGGGA